MSFIDKTRHGAKEFIAEKVFLAHLLNFFLMKACSQSLSHLLGIIVVSDHHC